LACSSRPGEVGAFNLAADRELLPAMHPTLCSLLISCSLALLEGTQHVCEGESNLALRQVFCALV
jgi:hypothetical protein